jgi:hypothetical protein
MGEEAGEPAQAVARCLSERSNGNLVLAWWVEEARAKKSKDRKSKSVEWWLLLVESNKKSKDPKSRGHHAITYRTRTPTHTRARGERRSVVLYFL